jgi:cell division protein FtsL
LLIQIAVEALFYEIFFVAIYSFMHWEAQPYTPDMKLQEITEKIDESASSGQEYQGQFLDLVEVGWLSFFASLA